MPASLADAGRGAWRDAPLCLAVSAVGPMALTRALGPHLRRGRATPLPLREEVGARAAPPPPSVAPWGPGVVFVSSFVARATFSRDLAACAASLQASRPAPPPPLPAQYAAAKWVCGAGLSLEGGDCSLRGSDLPLAARIRALPGRVSIALGLAVADPGLVPATGLTAAWPGGLAALLRGLGPIAGGSAAEGAAALVAAARAATRDASLSSDRSGGVAAPPYFLAARGRVVSAEAGGPLGGEGARALVDVVWRLAGEAIASDRVSC